MRLAGRVRGVTLLPLLLALTLGLAACGDKKGGATASLARAEAEFLFLHNAQFNDGRTVRWANLPVPVFLNGVGTAGEVTAWTAASGGRVTFAFVGSAPGAGIAMRFRSGTEICGITTVDYDDEGHLLAADIRVSQSVYRGPHCVRTVTHEVGHAIGFLNHTEDGGLMDDDGGGGAITSPVSVMFENLYALAPNTVVSVGQKTRLGQGRTGGRRSMTFVYPVRR